MNTRTRVVLTISAAALLYAPAARAQTLIVSPTCGVPGVTKVCITGTGWAEPAPPCRYEFFLDGAEVAPDQPDGLFGPPKQSFIVPAGKAPGTYPVRVDLRLNSPDILIQSKSTPFKVVATQKDPWTQASGTGGTMRIAFNPTDVCDVTPCKEIMFVQVFEQLGVRADGSTRTVTFTEQGFPNGAKLDADVTNGHTVDYLIGENDPYYNGHDPTDIGQQGSQNATSPTAATTNDTPGQGDASYPPDIQTIRVNFEVAAFCAVGDDAGSYLGRTLWTWERTKGAPGTNGTISGISTDRNPPSAAFIQALNQWNANHGFTKNFPVAKAPVCQ
jgi:hypothetical protein